MKIRKQSGKRTSMINISFAAILIIIATYNPEFYGFHLSNYMVFALAAICLLPFKRLALQIKRSDFFGFIVFYLIAFIYCTVSLDGGSLSVAVKLMIPLLVTLVCSSLRGKDKAETLLRYLFAANIFACLTGMVHFYILKDVTYMMYYNGAWIMRMNGAFEQPNIFAAFLAITIPSGVWCIMTGRKWGGGITEWLSSCLSLP